MANKKNINRTERKTMNAKTITKISGAILTSYIKMHVHVRACCRFSLSQSIDHFIIY